jgi:hypothetical protein
MPALGWTLSKRMAIKTEEKKQALVSRNRGA